MTKLGTVSAAVVSGATAVLVIVCRSFQGAGSTGTKRIVRQHYFRVGITDRPFGFYQSTGIPVAAH
jgi:hypothetical protein